MAFYELVIEGPYLIVKGLVEGASLCNKSKNSNVYFSREENIKRETLKEKLKEWLGVENFVHIIIDESSLNFWKETIKKLNKKLGVELISEKKIDNAHFNFKMEAFTEKHGKELKKLIDKLEKEGLQLIDKKIEEKKHNVKEEGIYTREHPYELYISGEVVGDPEKVIETYREWSKNSLIILDDIELDLE